MPKPRLHMIGNAHIDPVWLWRWQDGLEVAVSTCRNAVELLDKHPDYIFSRSSAGVYKWIEEADPDLFRRIRRFAARGRWNVVNGWWVQPDCNMPSGESFVRQGLYGQSYFKHKLGRMAKVGYNVDSFGHCGTLPQILVKSGLHYYVFTRPGHNEKSLPGDLFWWVSQDGSRVMACRVDGYACGDVKHLEEKMWRAIKRCRETGMDSMCFYGKGDHGGGPTEELILKIRQMSGQIDDVEICFSAPDAFFERVSQHNPDLPILRDDLQHHSRGCYTVVSEVKSRNRRLEAALLNAEVFCSMATMLFGVRYPRMNLRQSWETLLFHQFHDVLAGTSIKPAYDDAFRAFDVAEGLTRSATEMALEAFCLRIRTTGKEGQPLLIFNPAPCKREDPIEFQAVLGHKEDLVALDEKGTAHPVQVVKSSRLNGNRAVGGIFLAKLPPMGYRVFWITEGGRTQPPDMETLNTEVQNSLVGIKVDPKTGYLISLFDRSRGLELLSGPSRPIVVRDESDTWSHDVESFRDEIGAFHMDAFPIVESGPVRSSITVFSRYGRSRLVQSYVIHAGSPFVECRIDLDWHERHKMLKISYPVAVEEPKATYEIPYGTIERAANGQEEPGQRWLDVSGRVSDGSPGGLLLLNDCKYGFDVLGPEMRISLVRSPIYAFHRPRKPERGKRYLYTDQGRHSIRVALLPHGPLQTAAAFRHAERFNNPPIPAFCNRHEGPLPPTSSLALTNRDNVVIAAMKIAEERDALVIRLFESGGKATKTTLNLPLAQMRFELKLNPWEIKTVEISAKGTISEIDMLERPVGS